MIYCCIKSQWLKTIAFILLMNLQFGQSSGRGWAWFWSIRQQLRRLEGWRLELSLGLLISILGAYIEQIQSAKSQAHQGSLGICSLHMVSLAWLPGSPISYMEPLGFEIHIPKKEHRAEILLLFVVQPQKSGNTISTEFYSLEASH